MASDETIGRATVQLGADGTRLAPEMAAAIAKAQGAIESANRKAAQAQARVAKEIQGHINSINAAKPTNDMRMLEQAVLKLGGTSKLSADQLKRVTLEVNQLAAAGAKVPATLQGLTGIGSKLGSAFQALTTGGGVSGALAAIGPAGIAAAGALGAVTVAGGAAVREITALASQAEQWSNIAKSTGLGIDVVQQLSAMLEDAGIPAEALKKGMKALSDEIAGGGKQLEQFGVSIKGWDLMTQEERLRAMAKIIAEIEDPAEASAVAVAAFGKSGADLIPVMEDVASGAYTMYDALGEGGIAALAQADKTIDAFTRKFDSAKKRLLSGAIELAQGISFGPGGIPIFTGNPGAAADAAAAGGAKTTSASEEARQARQAAIEKAKAEKEAAAAAKQAAAEQKRLDAERLQKVREQIDAEVMLLKAREDETKAMQRQVDAIAAGSFAAEEGSRGPAKMGGLGSIQAADQARYEQAIKLAQAAQKAGLGVDQIRSKLEGMGLSAEDAAHVTDSYLTKQEEVNKSTDTAADRLGTLAQHLQVLASVTGGVAGKILGLAASLSSGLGGVLSGLDAFKSAGKGFTGFLGKLAGGAGIVGSAIGAIGGIVSGIKSLFGGKSKEQKAAEAAAKQQAADEARQAQIEAAQRRQAAGEQAKGFAEALSEKIAAGGLSEKLTGALSAFVGKMGEALGKLGLGIVDARLKDSKEFQAVSGVASDVAGGLGAAREAGIADMALTTAAGAAAEAIQQDAIAAARAAGLTDMEAAKQGSLAVAAILRQQLNTAIQTGRALDDNTRRLLEEAKANGIEILADPAIESLAVQKDIRSILSGQQPSTTNVYYGNGGETGGGTSSGGAVPREDYSPGPSDYTGIPEDYRARRRPIPAAGGLGPAMMPNLGGGLGPLIQTHAGEQAWIIPRSDVGSLGSPGGGMAGPGGVTVNNTLNVNAGITPLSSAENQREAIGLLTSMFGEVMRANNSRLIRDIADAVRPHL